MVGQCKGWKVIVAGMVIALIFSIVAIPVMERFGKYMALWSLCLWFSGVLCMAGFSIGTGKVVYVGYNSATNQSGIEYHYGKLSECGNGGYCYETSFLDR